VLGKSTFERLWQKILE
jgi:hypothetical protein